MPATSLRDVFSRIKDKPLVRPAYLRWKRGQFLSPDGYCAYFGVFDSFVAARAWLPPNPEFDHAPLAAPYVDVVSKKVFPYDYPVMRWLERALNVGSTSVLDIGGSVGVHYYAYQPYIDMPSALSWHVIEVPAMVAIGRDLARTTGAAALTFSDQLDEAIASRADDIWISAGAIQYMEHGRPDRLLRNSRLPPTHVLLNKVPLYNGPDFVTTQNIGNGAYTPVHVYNGARFVEDIEALGYVLRDRWEVPDRSLHVPGHPERMCPHFTGLYFASNTRARRPVAPVALPGRPAAAQETLLSCQQQLSHFLKPVLEAAGDDMKDTG